MVELEGEPARVPVRTPRKARTPAQKRAQENLKGQLRSSGRMLAACPMTPEELADQWSIGADDAESITVKVQRQIIGEPELELVESVPLVQYNGMRMAGKFGPGTYYIRPASGKYARNSAKINVSEDLAREAGFGRIRTPNPADSAAVQTIINAAEGPTDPKALVMAVSQMMDSKLEDFKRTLGGQAPGLVTDPMAAMNNQFAQLQGMMRFMTEMEERAIKTVELRMGIAKPEDTEMESSGGMMEKLLLKGLDVFQTIISQPRTPPAQGMIPANPQPQNVQQFPPQPPPALEDKKMDMPNLNEAELASLKVAAAALEPYGSTLVKMEAATLNDDQMIENLFPWIPEGMIRPLEDLAAIVAKHGTVVLSVIHPGMASERWGVILPKLVAALKEGLE